MARCVCVREMIKYLLLFVSLNVVANPLIETRYCGHPKRDAKGEIIRRADVLRTFQKIHPCPSTGLTTGACPNWQKNHPIPLACGGCDEVSNLEWLPVQIKTCTSWYCVDRFERRIYYNGIANTGECMNSITP